MATERLKAEHRYHELYWTITAVVCYTKHFADRLRNLPAPINPTRDDLWLKVRTASSSPGSANLIYPQQWTVEPAVPMDEWTMLEPKEKITTDENAPH